MSKLSVVLVYHYSINIEKIYRNSRMYSKNKYKLSFKSISFMIFLTSNLFFFDKNGRT